MGTATSVAARRNRGGTWALTALCLAFFVVQLDATVVNVALPAIRHDLGGGLGDQQWTIAGYTVALAAGMLTAGALGDRLGSRRLCVLGLGVFAVASIGCALAPSLPVLIGARVVQGAGAAALLPCSLALIVRQFADPGRRARALGVWGGIGSIGMATGPVVGGVLIALWSWRAIFLLNVPCCAVTAILLCACVAESPRQPGRRLDRPGLVLGTVALGALTGGLIEAGRLGWSAAVPLLLIVAGLAAGTAFVLVERRAPDPVLPLRIFTVRAFSAAATAGALFNFCLYGLLICLSLFLQGPLGRSAFAAGLLILPLTAAVGVGAALSGRLTAKLGARVPMLLGFGLGGAGALLLLLTGPRGPLWLVVAGSVVLGCCAFAMPAMTSVAMSAADARHTGRASGVLNTARQTGGALGTAVLGTLLALGGGTALDLRAPALVAVLGYAAATAATLLATPSRPPSV
jgi:MFS transporter, DHA2 family, methylenomycin A resistance protein